jgi:hypothetical protein
MCGVRRRANIPVCRNPLRPNGFTRPRKNFASSCNFMTKPLIRCYGAHSPVARTGLGGDPMSSAFRCPERTVARIRRAAAGALTTAGLVVAGLSVPVAPAAAGVADAPAAVDEATASAIARSTGARTEATALRTENQTVYANADGTWTLDQSNEVVRVRRGDSWVAVDPTLVRRADGTVAPNATTLDTAFSGGGTAPLATVGKEGLSVSLSWPGPLPAPSLDGATATYAEVLPGVDLVVTALPGGFSEVLVVKSRAAALNPALRRVAFATTSKGLALRPDAGGGFSAIDASGRAVLLSPESTMWDSHGGSGGRSRAVAAHEGDRVVPMRTEVTAASVAIVPDAALLADPATSFPLYIDPTILNATHSKWAMVDETYPSNEYYNFTGDQGVGYQNFSGVSKKRQFHAFTTSALAGTHVLDAKFKAYETHSASCTMTEVELWETGGISSTTNWSNQPTWTKYITSRTVAYGYTTCTPAGAWVEFEADVAAQDAANTSAPTLTLGLRAGSETSNLYWKRFDYAAQLSVTYNRDPLTPHNLRIVTPSGKTCTTGTSRAWINDATPTLAGIVDDPDGGNVYAQFDYGQIGVSPRTTTQTAAKAEGSEFQFTVPSGAMSGNPDVHAYSWRIKGYDGYDYSAFSGLCEFYLDTLAPTQVPTIVSTAFPPNGTAVSTYGVGQAGGSFTLDAGTNDNDILYYKYSFNSDSFASKINASTLGGPATLSYTPTQAGLNFLKVRSYDRADNPGPYATYYFKTPGLLPNADFMLDQASGLTTTDSVGNRTATLAGGATWGHGRYYDYDSTYYPNDGALVLDGVTGSIASTTTGIVDTSKPFTVGLNVYLERPDSDTGTHKVLSQNSVSTSAFQIGYENLQWFFRMAQTDSGTTAWSTAYVAADADISVWTHLTAVYDGRVIYLVVDVDGQAQKQSLNTAHTSTFGSSGSFIMGAGRSSNYWPGRIDRVKTFPGVLDSTEINTLAYEPPPA